MHNIDNMVVLCKYERTTTQINLSFGIFVITVVLKGERKFRPKKKKGERNNERKTKTRFCSKIRDQKNEQDVK